MVLSWGRKGLQGVVFPLSQIFALRNVKLSFSNLADDLQFSPIGNMIFFNLQDFLSSQGLIPRPPGSLVTPATITYNSCVNKKEDFYQLP